MRCNILLIILTSFYLSKLMKAGLWLVLEYFYTELLQDIKTKNEQLHTSLF